MYLLFDIGGTKMRLAISRDKKTFEEPKIIDTPKTFSECVTAFGAIAKELAGGEKIELAVGGITGAMDKTKSVLHRSPHMPDWIGKPFREEFEKVIGAKVYPENDSAIVGLGEAVAGAGKGFDIVAYITVSTGVGGARIVGSKIEKNAMGFEPGHQIMNMPDSNPATDDTLQTLENCVSGTAMEKRFSKKPYEIVDDALWEELAEKLAFGMHNTIVHWSPDILVLGGSMMVGNPKIQTERVAFYLKKIMKIFPELPVVKEAELANVGGLHGALAYLNQVLQ